MSGERRRLPLRERVAARRAGRPEYVDTGRSDGENENAWRKRIALIAIILQAAAMLLTLWETWILIGRNFVGIDFTRLTVYIVIFFLGRFIQILLKFKR